MLWCFVLFNKKERKKERNELQKSRSESKDLRTHSKVLI